MKKLIIASLISLLFYSCTSNENRFRKSPVDQMIIEMSDLNDFTIILEDMDAEEHLFTQNFYRHKYKVITLGADSIPQVKKTDWYDVSQDFFQLHSGDIGMEIASKVDGKLSKQVSPPGYSGYVGNERYGHWQRDNSGQSFWVFYGQYAMMRSIFNMGYYGRVYRSGYYDYTSHYRSGRNYYGGSVGTPKYGTYSSGAQKANPTFSNRMSSSSGFKNTVNRSVSRSPARYSAGSRASSTSSSSRSNSSSSRYGSGSSSRSRSYSRGGK
ncbi:hypothetical protein KMW28_07330 [Flammeovirga yaeyamensis]|uniref:Lipoprotein n=1 Tax=Flammeovirga yaeyamensis TaxID=367791 RepID=A0AAX1N758_9BACT|nr:MULTISPECIES: hypothetical protein [Flammeovirga]ANQ49145.1 hypothetical protein MY04_1771 [Flammeovirga sp. MY04]MBB3697992.1 hypothetical protein [Flammeovirga yaeyamensis]NMF35656.1 hypothetical protein [Flammeovirga yaeyamensis]QWG03388.1 hypothetical protein KMW28_07330 [Flammeovirga yaeyamensis]